MVAKEAKAQNLHVAALHVFIAHEEGMTALRQNEIDRYGGKLLAQFSSASARERCYVAVAGTALAMKTAAGLSLMESKARWEIPYYRQLRQEERALLERAAAIRWEK